MSFLSPKIPKPAPPPAAAPEADPHAAVNARSAFLQRPAARTGYRATVLSQGTANGLAGSRSSILGMPFSS